MASEKKFLSPVLYPVNKAVNRKWFIKYQEENYVTGRFTAKKYYGQLNLLHTAEERLKLAQQYLTAMQRGEALPNYQGARNLAAPEHPRTYANAIHCCHKFYEDRKHEIANLTRYQYHARINVLAAWLQEQGKGAIAIGGITTEDARLFLSHLKEVRQYTNKTYNDYKIMLGTVWNEYVNDGKLKVNPWRKIKTLPDETRHYTSYPTELRVLMRETLPQFDPQLWLFVQTIYYCAIRPQYELRLLQVKHLHQAKQLFYVPKEIAKGAQGKKRARWVTIPTPLFEQYTQAGYHLATPESYLFTTDGRPGTAPVSINYFRHRWNEYKRAYGIAKEYKMYGSKHTAGKSLSAAMNDYITTEHFGHRDRKSTRHYTEGIAPEGLTKLRTEYPVF